MPILVARASVSDNFLISTSLGFVAKTSRQNELWECLLLGMHTRREPEEQSAKRIQECVSHVSLVFPWTSFHHLGQLWIEVPSPLVFFQRCFVREEITSLLVFYLNRANFNYVTAKVFWRYTKREREGVNN